MYALSIPKVIVVVDFWLSIWHQECFYGEQLGYFYCLCKCLWQWKPTLLYIQCMNLWCMCTKKVHEMAIVGMIRDSFTVTNHQVHEKISQFFVKRYIYIYILWQSLAWKQNRSPGIDGIPAEVYKMFNSDFISLLTTLFNSILRTVNRKAGYGLKIPCIYCLYSSPAYMN